MTRPMALQPRESFWMSRCVAPRAPRHHQLWAYLWTLRLVRAWGLSHSSGLRFCKIFKYGWPLNTSTLRATRLRKPAFGSTALQLFSNKPYATIKHCNGPVLKTSTPTECRHRCIRQGHQTGPLVAAARHLISPYVGRPLAKCNCNRQHLSCMSLWVRVDRAASTIWHQSLP